MSRPARRLHSRLIFAAAAAAAGLAGGCSRHAPMVEVMYVPPPGLTATTADKGVAAPIGRRLRAMPDVDRVSSISAPDEVDCYVVGTPGSLAGPLADRARAAVAAAAPDLPAGGRLLTVAFLSSLAPIPDAAHGTVPAYKATLDAARAAAAGVTAREVDATLAHLTSPDRPAAAGRIASLSAEPVATVAGQHVPLGEVATITIEQQPVSVRHDY